MAAPIVEATRTGPWTADEVLALGEDRELGSTHEVVDGSLLLSPSPNYDHQRIARRLSFALEDGLPAGYEVFDGGNVRIDHDNLLIPDVVVLRRPKPRLVAATPADVLLGRGDCQPVHAPDRSHAQARGLRRSWDSVVRTGRA